MSSRFHIRCERVLAKRYMTVPTSSVSAPRTYNCFTALWFRPGQVRMNIRRCKRSQYRTTSGIHTSSLSLFSVPWWKVKTELTVNILLCTKHSTVQLAVYCTLHCIKTLDCIWASSRIWESEAKLLSWKRPSVPQKTEAHALISSSLYQCGLPSPASVPN